MKKIKIIILIIIALFWIQGCTPSEKNNSKPEQSTQEQSAQDQSAPVQSSNSLVVKKTEPILPASTFEVTSILNQEEAKIDCTLNALSTNGTVVWSKTWPDLYLTELNPYSDYVLGNNRLYIEVDGKLYILDQATGEELFSPLVVGAIEIPVLDSEENIYCSGYYGPTLTKISTDGTLIWQTEERVDLYWPGTPQIIGNYVYVPFSSAETDGFNWAQYDATTGKMRLIYALDDGEILWESVLASSTLDAYTPDLTLDNNPKTAWVEGVFDEGIGEWLLFESAKEQTLTKLSIKNGYHKSEQLYTENNRIKTIQIETDSGEKMTFELNDQMATIELLLDHPLKTKSLKLTILSVYLGTKYNDTVITDVKVY